MLCPERAVLVLLSCTPLSLGVVSYEHVVIQQRWATSKVCAVLSSSSLHANSTGGTACGRRSLHSPPQVSQRTCNEAAHKFGNIATPSIYVELELSAADVYKSTTESTLITHNTNSDFHRPSLLQHVEYRRSDAESQREYHRRRHNSTCLLRYSPDDAAHTVSLHSFSQHFDLSLYEKASPLATHPARAQSRRRSGTEGGAHAKAARRARGCH